MCTKYYNMYIIKKIVFYVLKLTKEKTIYFK